MKPKNFCILRKIELRWNNFHEYSCFPYLVEDEACVLMNQGQHKVKASNAILGSQRGRNTLIISNLWITQHVLLTGKLISQHGTKLVNYCSYPLNYIYELDNTRGKCYTFDLSISQMSFITYWRKKRLTENPKYNAGSILIAVIAVCDWLFSFSILLMSVSTKA